MVKKPVVGSDLPETPDNERLYGFPDDYYQREPPHYDIPAPWFAAIEGFLYTPKKYTWLGAVLNLLEPPQGYVADNGADDETTAVLCMVMQGLLLPPEHPQHAKAKAAFISCCAKLWDDNASSMGAE